MSTKEIRFDTAQAWPERGVSILNGMLGDYLHKRGNNLAIAMSFRHRGLPLELTEAGLRAAHASLSTRLCVLVHGFCCNESVWTFPGSATPGDSYGSRLERDLGYTPFYIRYNTGLPIAENGTHLANMLHDLVSAYPLPVDEITLIGHSMGGLVMRSACDSSRTEAAGWQGIVKRAIYVGTPHDGADLERFAHVTRLIGDILNLRSRGVKDLAAGHVQAESGTQPWLASARHHLLMGTLTKDPEHPVGRIFGDALVRVPRAGAPSAGQESSPDIIVFPGVHHLALAHDESIYRCIRQLCARE
jgi:triacylglycerol lipase